MRDREIETLRIWSKGLRKHLVIMVVRLRSRKPRKTDWAALIAAAE